MAASLGAAPRCVFFVQGVVPLRQLWSSAPSIYLGRPVGDAARRVRSVGRRRWRSRGAARWRPGRRRRCLHGAGRGVASVRRGWEGLLSAVRGGRGRRSVWFHVGGRRGRRRVAAASSVEGRRRRRSGGAVLHPAACGGAVVVVGGARDVGERGAVGALVLRGRRLVGRRGRGGACGGARGGSPGARGPQGRPAHRAAD